MLRAHFSDEQLLALTPRMDPSRPTGLDYYPLLTPGERFPVNDPALPPRLEPRPSDEARFLQGRAQGQGTLMHARSQTNTSTPIHPPTHGQGTLMHARCQTNTSTPIHPPTHPHTHAPSLPPCCLQASWRALPASKPLPTAS